MIRTAGLRTAIIAGLSLAASAASAQPPTVFGSQERSSSFLDVIFGAPKRPATVYTPAGPTVPPLNLTSRATAPAQAQSATTTVKNTAPVVSGDLPRIGSSPAPKAAAPRAVVAGSPDSPSHPTGYGSSAVSRRTGGGGSLAVCVRTCDGFFFPVNYEGARGGDKFAEACQASCPNAETEVYFKRPGADMDSAANAKGRNYTQLPNAFKYRTQRDNACTCKGEGQTWAQALKNADEIIGARKNDVIVTQEQSNQLSRPEQPVAASKAKDKLASAGDLTPKSE